MLERLHPDVSSVPATITRRTHAKMRRTDANNAAFLRRATCIADLTAAIGPRKTSDRWKTGELRISNGFKILRAVPMRSSENAG